MGKLINELESLKLTSAGFRAGSYNEGINAALHLIKTSLPTQPELVEVPEFVGEWIEEYKKNGFNLYGSVSAMTIGDVNEWYLDNENLYEQAWVNSYTVKKEQLYYVKVGNLVFSGWEDSFVAKLATTDSPAWTNYAHKIPTKDGAENIARIIGGEAVPVDQEQKLPQEVEVSEYLEEEE